MLPDDRLRQSPPSVRRRDAIAATKGHRVARLNHDVTVVSPSSTETKRAARVRRIVYLGGSR